MKILVVGHVTEKLSDSIKQSLSVHGIITDVPQVEKQEINQFEREPFLIKNYRTDDLISYAPKKHTHRRKSSREI